VRYDRIWVVRSQRVTSTPVPFIIRHTNRARRITRWISEHCGRTLRSPDAAASTFPLERCQIYTSLLNVLSQKPAVSIKTCFKIIPRLHSSDVCCTGHTNCLKFQVLWDVNSSWPVTSCQRFGENYLLTPSKCQ
jgi:hypothetical protein